jgi:hypothetical protein
MLGNDLLWQLQVTVLTDNNDSNRKSEGRFKERNLQRQSMTALINSYHSQTQSQCCIHQNNLTTTTDTCIDNSDNINVDMLRQYTMWLDYLAIS